MKNTITTVKNKTTLQDPSSKNHHKMAWGDLGHSTNDKIKNYLLKLIHPPFDEVISRRASKSNIDTWPFNSQDLIVNSPL